MTGFLTARTERRKAEAADRQAERQQAAAERTQVRELRVEHRRWRRDRRQAAYLAFTLTVGEARQLADDGLALLAQGAPDRSRAEELMSGLAVSAKEAKTALATVRLEGPSAVGEAALAYHDGARFDATYVRTRLADAEPAVSHVREYTEHTRLTTDAEVRFLEEAEKALAELTDPS
ncbi:hypothetical protein [Kitasatospora xanthocidica]|uniref:hypothetical protein n=1 Tax=Kitasatospora xanthocidica TaxID=83382 RepID=UPI00167A75D8|nr:hypothetical protein [Kitasatospora xanthocidica]